MSDYTRVTYLPDGATSAFSVPWPYLDQSHVHALLNGVLVDASFFLNNSDPTIYFGANPPAGSVLVIFRRTPIADPAVVFSSGTLYSASLNLVADTLRFAIQETEEVLTVAAGGQYLIVDPADHSEFPPSPPPPPPPPPPFPPGSPPSPPGTGPAFVSAGTLAVAQSVATSTTLNVPYPASPVAWDIALLHIQWLNELGIPPDLDPDTISGWTPIVGPHQTDLGHYHVIYAKYLLGSESGSVTVSSGGITGNGGFLAGVLSYWTKVDVTGVFVDPNKGGTFNTASTHPQGANITTGTAKELAITADAMVTFNAGNQSSSPAAGWTEAYDLYSATGPGVQMTMSYKAIATASAVTTEVRTTPQPVSFIGDTFALLPHV